MPGNQLVYNLSTRIFGRAAFVTGVISVLSGAAAVITPQASLFYIIVPVVFSVIFLFSIYMLLRKKPILVLTESGITSSTASKSEIPWENIRAIQVVEIRKQQLLCITVDSAVINRLSLTPFLEKRRQWIISTLGLTLHQNSDYVFAAISNLSASPEQITATIKNLAQLSRDERVRNLKALGVK
ncbi:MAG: hypothetical protein MUC87_15515 [Bacteroidia bacterium]|nr:hypothetical protein [Bacteroidia bacterium]